MTDRPMRVAIVSPGFPPTPGGVERHVGRIAAGITDLGHRVEVFTSRRGLRRKEIALVDGVVVHTYPAWRIRALSVSPRLMLGVLAQRRRFDVLHVHSFHASSGLATLAGRGVPVVFTPHYHGGGHTGLAVFLHRLYGIPARRIFAATRSVVCVSDAERRLLEHDHPVVVGRSRVIPNGIDVAALVAAEPFAVERPVVLGVGRLEAYKRWDLLVSAMLDLTARDVDLVLVGSGPAEEALREQAVGAGGRIRILTGLDDEAVQRWYATADVFVSLSLHEAFGIAPLEAAVAGAQVVLTDIPAHRELAGTWLAGRATLVDGDIDAISRAIRAALSARPGRPALRPPDWAQVSKCLAACYEELRA